MSRCPRPGTRSQDRLAAQVGGAVDLYQDANAGVGAVVRLFALGELGEDGIVNGSGFVQFRGSEEAQEAGIRGRRRAAP